MTQWCQLSHLRFSEVVFIRGNYGPLSGNRLILSVQKISSKGDVNRAPGCWYGGQFAGGFKLASPKLDCMRCHFDHVINNNSLITEMNYFSFHLFSSLKHHFHSRDEIWCQTILNTKPFDAWEIIAFLVILHSSSVQIQFIISIPCISLVAGLNFFVDHQPNWVRLWFPRLIFCIELPLPVVWVESFCTELH